MAGMLLSGGAAFAQTQVKGVVVSDEDGQPLFLGYRDRFGRRLAEYRGGSGGRRQGRHQLFEAAGRRSRYLPAADCHPGRRAAPERG